MNETPLAPKSDRLLSLDVFRGMTIAGMILVNHPGSWGRIYKPLAHAPWDGWTPTDLVFPFFLFIVGVAMTISFDRRVQKGQSRWGLLGHVVRRGAILILLGLTMSALPDIERAAPYILSIAGLTMIFWHEPPLGLGAPRRVQLLKAAGAALLFAGAAMFAMNFTWWDQKGQRVPGVLQRIGLVYIATGAIVLWTRTRGRLIWAAGLMLGYWALVKFVPPPGGGDYGLPAERAPYALNEWLDQTLLGGHLYRERPDPEGLLSTLAAIATALLGVLTGQWIQGARDRWRTLAGLFIAGNLLLAAGMIFDPLMPINKKVWTSPYVLFMAGFALSVLGLCYWAIDIRGWRKWSWPLMVFGTNAILVFFAAHYLGKLMNIWKVTLADGTQQSVYPWIYKTVFVTGLGLGEMNGSLAFALTYVVFWLLLLIPLYKYKIFLKI